MLDSEFVFDIATMLLAAGMSYYAYSIRDTFRDSVLGDLYRFSVCRH